MDLAAALSRLTTLGAESRRRRIERQAPTRASQVPPASSGLEKVTTAVLTAARVQPGDLVIDLGCGGGQVSLQLADLGARVIAVDGNQRALDRLKASAIAGPCRGFGAWPGPCSGCRCRVRAQTSLSRVMPCTGCAMPTSNDSSRLPSAGCGREER